MKALALALVVSVGLLVVAGGAYSQAAGGGTAKERADHPVVDKAIAQIGEIMADLQSRGSERMGGHRTKALDLLKQAQQELREGLAYSRARQDVAGGALDINKATADQLRVLPGMSEAEAKKIVASRPYKSPDDLVKKKVLSQAQYDKIKDQVTVK